MAGLPHILIVEDEPLTRTTLTSYLAANGYRVSDADSADAAEVVLAQEDVDLLIIDINLQGKDGLQITREQRARSEIGIILVTGRTDDVDRIVGLELGADDYVCKPFNRRELLARIKNLLRRTSALQRLNRSVFRFDGMIFDLNKRHLQFEHGDAIRLTRAEYELLCILLRHPGEVLSRDRLMRAVTHRQAGTDPRMVDVTVRRLRTKLEANPTEPRLITTSHGEGYVFTGMLT